MKKGYIQVYTGNGKGKTTAALGLGLRAVGRGKRILMIQFLKGRFTGELESIKNLGPGFRIIRFAETKKFFNQMTEDEKEELRISLKEDMKRLNQYIGDDQWDIIILDEIMGVMNNGLIDVEKVCHILDNKPSGLELILTGRNVPEAIAHRADLITEMREIKHYSHAGVPARKGIEL